MNEFSPLAEDFKKNPNYASVSIDDITYVKYSNGSNVKLFKATVPQHMLIILLEGTKLIFNKKEILKIQSGESFFIPVGTHLLSEIVSELNSFKSLVFFIGDDFLNNFIDSYIKKAPFPYIKGYTPEVFKVDFNTSYTTTVNNALPFLLENTEFSSPLFKLKLTELLLMVLSTKKGGEYFNYLSDQKINCTNELVSFMELNFFKPYSVNDFALEYGKSLSAYKREFSLNYNQSPKKWINNRRLELSYKLLKYTELNISEICARVGFSNLSYFIQLFKTKYGLTPKTVQKNLIQQK